MPAPQEVRRVPATLRAGWSRMAARVAVYAIALVALGLYLLARGFILPALAVGLVGLALAVGLALLVFGSRIELTEAELLLRNGFLACSFPWRDVRGFVVDGRSPSEVYVAVLHPDQQTLMLFEVPPVESPSPLALAARLREEWGSRRRGEPPP